MTRIYYAIGDIHGERDRLQSLHTAITDYHAQHFPDAEQTRVHLGDYVDRGPDSCGVIDFIMEMEHFAPFDVISLKGNHEKMMLNACVDATEESRDFWARNGGEETVESYRRRGHDGPTARHLNWLSNLPTKYIVQDSGLVFVHAGIDPDAFPACSEAVNLWTRSPMFFDSPSWTNPQLENMRVIHGHTPTDDSQPDVMPDGRRINLDTGACYGGRLTAAILSDNQETNYLFA